MNVLPVIAREMRMQSRQAATYGLRVLGGGALLAVGTLALVSGGFGLQDGAELFHRMHMVLFWTIWLVVPLATADCISRERREGTLPLLLLTPLTVRDIVMAKGLAHGMRAMTLGLAAIPVLVVPFLLGGVDWMEVGLSATINLSSFCWAMGAGLLATSRNRKLQRSLVWSAVWAVCLFWLMAVLLIVILWIMVMIYILPWPFPQRWHLDWRLLRDVRQISMELLLNLGGLQDFMLAFGRPWHWISSWVAGGFLSVSVMGLWFCLWLAGRNVRVLSRDDAPSATRVKMERVFCSPSIAKGLFRRWMLRKIERNPIGWLEQRTWQARLVTWSWLAVLVSIYSLALGGTGTFGQILELNQGFAYLMLGTMALTAAGSFRRERESGVMELLMVSPLSTRQVIWGRLRGIWGQFLAAVVLLTAVWLYMAWFVFDPYNNLKGLFANECLSAGLMLTGFAAVPAIGLYFSLRCRHYMTALAWTVLVGLLVPMILSEMGSELSIQFILDENRWGATTHPAYVTLAYMVPALVQIGLAAMFTRWLSGNLENRTFAMGREVT